MKAKQSKNRDNKILCLNSDDEDSEPEEEIPRIDKKVEDDFKNLFGTLDKQSTKTGSQTDPDAMEFDDTEKPKIQPPPLQNSKDYYNSTQRMTDAMIQNPQFQIFSIDEEETVQTTSSRPSVRQTVIEEESVRGSIISQKAENTPSANYKGETAQIASQIDNYQMESMR